VFIHDFPFAMAANDDDGGNGGAMREHDTITRSHPFPKRKYFRFFHHLSSFFKFTISSHNQLDSTGNE
jgi:hypothetical protein